MNDSERTDSERPSPSALIRRVALLVSILIAGAGGIVAATGIHGRDVPVGGRWGGYGFGRSPGSSSSGPGFWDKLPWFFAGRFWLGAAIVGLGVALAVTSMVLFRE